MKYAKLDQTISVIENLINFLEAQDFPERQLQEKIVFKNRKATVVVDEEDPLELLDDMKNSLVSCKIFFDQMDREYNPDMNKYLKFFSLISENVVKTISVAAKSVVDSFWKRYFSKKTLMYCRGCLDLAVETINDIVDIFNSRLRKGHAGKLQHVAKVPWNKLSEETLFEEVFLKMKLAEGS